MKKRYSKKKYVLCGISERDNEHLYYVGISDKYGLRYTKTHIDEGEEANNKCVKGKRTRREPYSFDSLERMNEVAESIKNSWRLEDAFWKNGEDVVYLSTWKNEDGEVDVEYISERRCRISKDGKFLIFDPFEYEMGFATHKAIKITEENRQYIFLTSEKLSHYVEETFGEYGIKVLCKSMESKAGLIEWKFTDKENN